MKPDSEQPLDITNFTSTPGITRRHFVKRAGAASAATAFGFCLTSTTQASGPYNHVILKKIYTYKGTASSTAPDITGECADYKDFAARLAVIAAGNTGSWTVSDISEDIDAYEKGTVDAFKLDIIPNGALLFTDIPDQPERARWSINVKSGNVTITVFLLKIILLH